MSFSIRQKQHDAVVQMLNLNPGRLGGGLSLNEHAPTEVYKVLIMDKHCFAIITPLVKVHELRRHGVTLHLLLENDRQPIPDVPALYFVSPTAENVQRITSDLKKNLYDAHYLNFSSSLPRKLLEDLAVKSTECGTSGKITKVFDQYLDFVSLAPTLFSLGRPDSYATLNDPSSSDQSVEGEVSQITQGLLAVCATLGKAPVIRCQKGGAAEAVARALEQTLRDHLKGKNGLFAGDASGATHDRPLLVLFDRAFDIPAAVKHDWKYAPLVHDILKMKLNRVDIGGDAAADRFAGAAGKKSYDLEPEHDSFWRNNFDSQFPVVAEAVEHALGAYKKSMAEITSATRGETGDAVGGGESHGNDTRKLVTAVASLPQLQEHKKTIDKHTNIATALLQAIKQRGLDEYHVVEEDLLAGKGDAAAIMGLLDATGRGTPEDKLRLAIVRACASSRLRQQHGNDYEAEATSESENEAVEGALRASGADTAALEFLKKILSLGAGGGLNSGMGSHPGEEEENEEQGGDLLDWADRLYGQSIDAVAKGVQSLLRGDTRGAVARATRALCLNQPGSVPEVDHFLWFDPKAALAERERMPASLRDPTQSYPSQHASQTPPAFRKAIVFVVGGGNYGEYQEVLGLANAGDGDGHQSAATGRGGSGGGLLQVVYGATELVTGDEFVGQLGTLGRKLRR